MEKREPDFYEDNEKYGKFGEADCVQFYETIGYNVKDVSNDLEFQASDIDFVVSKQPIKLLDLHNILFSRECHKIKDDGKREIYKIEVKTDTVGLNTRNVLYEFIAHDFAGCLGGSKADFIYYVFVDDTTGEVVKKEAWSIDLMKWRQYIREHFFDPSITMDEAARTWGIKRNNLTRIDKNTGEPLNGGNLLCNIDKLQEYGVAKKVF